MKKLIITVGPSIFEKTILKEIHNGNYIYRINGAHGTTDQVRKYVNDIRTHVPKADILLDLPGNKVRTANLPQPIEVRQNKLFKLHKDQTNFPLLAKYLNKGDRVLADDSTLSFTVKKVNKDTLEFESNSNGQLRNNKGLHVRGIHRKIPFLFRKDKDLALLANELKISHIGLSFVRTAEDIKMAKKIIDPEMTIISKIETKQAVANLNSILELVDHILIDRGDLSAEIGLEKVPACQKFIIEKAHFFDKRVFLSTQFLKNMEEKPIPTIAEVIDLYNTLKMGVYGVQLSEETSIGKFPRECLQLINRVEQEIYHETPLKENLLGE